MRQPLHRFVGHLFVLSVVGIAVPAVPHLVSASAATAPDAAPPVAEELVAAPAADGVAPELPEDVQRVVASDMAIDWVGGAPEGAQAALDASPSPADHHRIEEGVDHAAAMDPAHGTTEHHAAASGGYAVFSETARWLPSGYTIRLTGGDGRVEQYRDEIQSAAAAASLVTGVPVRVAAGFGGPADPRRGEIAVVLGGGPCGSTAVGCGGPTLTTHDVLAGRVWFHPTALDLSPGHRANLAAHELGHALGLQHFDAAWTDGGQVMFPRLSDATSYRTGDAAGLRFVAGASDRPAGAVTWRKYAAGRAHIAGTVASGSRIRITAGAAAVEVRASDGHFSGALNLDAGSHVVCASVLDAGQGFRRNLGCAAMEAPGKPVGHLGRVVGSFQTIRIRGWSIDPQTAGPVQVEVRRNGNLVTTALADHPRGDLGARVHHYGADHGFDVEVPAEAGRNQLCMRALGVGGGGDLDLGCAEIVHAVDPIGAVDVLRADGPGVRVGGWALDPNTPDPVTVVVHVNGKVPPAGGTTQASQERTDVGHHHPAHGPNRGFSHWVPVTPGRHTVCVSAVNVGLGRDQRLGCREVVVEDVPKATAAAGAAVGGVVRGVLAAP